MDIKIKNCNGELDTIDNVVKNLLDSCISSIIDGLYHNAALSFMVSEKGKIICLIEFDSNDLPQFQELVYGELINAGVDHIYRNVV